MDNINQKDHEARNNVIIIFTIAVVVFVALGYFSGGFALIHDMNVETQKGKDKINSDIKAENSCSNLANFIKPYADYWNKPYAVQKAQERMVELKC